jgi:hypothetical protein
VHDDRPILPPVIAVQLNYSATVQQRTLDGVGRAFREELVARKVSIVRAVDEIMGQRLVHGVLVNERLAGDKVVPGEHKLVKRVFNVILLPKVSRRVLALPLTEEAFDRILGDSALLFVEESFEDDRGNIAPWVEYA